MCTHPEREQRSLFLARDYISGDPFSLFRCGACGLIRTFPQPSPATMDRFYPQTYYGQSERYNPLVERLLRCIYAYRAWGITRTNTLPMKRVLDIGCGRGLLLDQLRKRGWEVLGTELSDRSASYAREVLGLGVETADITDLHLDAESFSTVILWHVLEHVPDPAGLLQEIARILCPGGTLLVAVPNVASPEARWAKARWFHLDVPRHLHHFGPDSMRAILRAAGLQPVSVRYFALEYDCFSFVQTVLNMLGLRHNALFNLLRTRGAKLLQGKRPLPVADLIASLLLAPVLGAISAVWVPAVALSGRGATMTIFARKPLDDPSHPTPLDPQQVVRAEPQ